VTNPKVKDLKKKCAKYARETKRLNTETLKHIGAVNAKLAAGALASISEGARISIRLDKMEARILFLLSGWSILDIECLLVHRVLPEAKRRAKLPK
jgi:hypothetical protein